VSFAIIISARQHNYISALYAIAPPAPSVRLSVYPSVTRVTRRGWISQNRLEI